MFWEITIFDAYDILYILYFTFVALSFVASELEQFPRLPRGKVLVWLEDSKYITPKTLQ